MDLSRIESALSRAIDFRRSALDGVVDDKHAAVRLVDGEGDNLAGLVVEKYGQVIRIETKIAELRAALPDIVKTLHRSLDITGVVDVYRKAGASGRVDMNVIDGVVDEVLVVQEQIDVDTCRFRLRPRDTNAAGIGIFLDVRHVRAFVHEHAHGRRVLNLFSHAGAFSVAAARGGASHIDSVDLSAKCAKWAAENLTENGIDAKSHRFVVEDAFRFVERRVARTERYDFIVCDPPTQAKVRRKGTRAAWHFSARSHLQKLIADCFRLLDDDGIVCISCNDRTIDAASLRVMISAASDDVGRPFKSLLPYRLPADFRPTQNPSSISTKGFFVQFATA